jgi:hypothetical protein
MKTGKLPRPLTADEYEKMMSEFDLASVWMREQLALRHARSAPGLPAPVLVTGAAAAMIRRARGAGRALGI